MTRFLSRVGSAFVSVGLVVAGWLAFQLPEPPRIEAKPFSAVAMQQATALFPFSLHTAADAPASGGAATGAPQVHEVTKEKLDRAKAAYEKATGGKADAVMTEAGMQEIYKAGGFATVKTLIEDRVISVEHSLQMADLRILMCMRAIERVLANHKGEWKIYRSDSGNQSSGMSSDIDQTIYVYAKDKDGRWVRAEDLDSKFLAEFNEEFTNANGGLKVADVDIATIAGRDKFPDPRNVKTQLNEETRRSGRRAFLTHAIDTMESLRDTPGAYTYCGAVVQQMQLRVEKLIDDTLRRDPKQADPEDAHEIVEEVDGKKVPRKIAIHGELLKAGVKRLRWLP